MKQGIASGILIWFGGRKVHFETLEITDELVKKTSHQWRIHMN